ncbi:MAG: elongation factor P-like protein YeiP [Cycloclasticus sp.]|nr:elongation factor P-like protein YeiP [Cycloclasticus sp.]MBG95994.1 elongation factor P-like protein YeiP [Cycloclasticus sp.]|tara:strand:- start:1364 stop:1930 length:567 start_codon:yes stop_codon:yes gene_type:complete
MPKANELKCGMIVEVNDEPYSVKSIDVRNPSSRGAATLYKVRFNHLKTKQKRDETLKGDDFLKDVDCERVKLQYSYQDGDTYTFMNLDSYDQYTVDSDDIAEQIKFLTEGLDSIVGILLDGLLVAIELPSSVSLQIIDTAPGLKSASATSRTKPAVLTTGLEIQVPEYIDNNDVIKINTSTGKFLSRA